MLCASCCIAAQVDAKMMFGDRNLHITVARVWASLSSWEKFKLIWTLVHTGVNMPSKEEIAEELEAMKVQHAWPVILTVCATGACNSLMLFSSHTFLKSITLGPCNRLSIMCAPLCCVIPLCRLVNLQNQSCPDQRHLPPASARVTCCQPIILVRCRKQTQSLQESKSWGRAFLLCLSP